MEQLTHEGRAPCNRVLNKLHVFHSLTTAIMEITKKKTHFFPLFTEIEMRLFLAKCRSVKYIKIRFSRGKITFVDNERYK